jgi:UDP-GlcNAc:undecaprenyl-phosphate GlcNAc-1-phosphate transferase
MRSYIVLFLIAIVLTLVLTPLIGRLAIALGAIDIPDNERRIHKKPTPRLGGVAIYLGFLLTLGCVPFLQNDIGDRFNAHPRWYLSIVVSATIVFLLGVYDDLKGCSAWFKIAVQAAAAVLLQYLGFGIELVSLPFFGENFVLPQGLGFVLTLIWILGITNAFNLVDGVDGLAAGISAFALLSILFTAVAGGNFEIGLLAVILLGAVIGFLYYNFHPASIFLGDSGSLTLGFMVAVLSLIGAQKGTTTIAIAIPMVSFGLPIVEIFLSLIRRFVGGKPLMQSDRGHIHHRLLDHGLSVRQTTILLYGVCGVFCLFGILLLNPRRSLAALIFSTLGVLIVVGVQRLRYPEFEVIGSKIRQGVTRRRRRMIANVNIRQVCAAMKQTADAKKIFSFLRQICEMNDFEGITLELRTPAAMRHKSMLASGAEMNDWKPMAASASHFSWGKVHPGNIDELTTAEAMWSLRVPLNYQHHDIGAITFYRKLGNEDLLVDLNSICGAFQQELSRALDNLLKQTEDKPETIIAEPSLLEGVKQGL